LASSLTGYICMPSGSCKTARKDQNAGGERCTDCSAAKKSDELPPPPRLAPHRDRWARAVPYTSKLEGSPMSEMGHSVPTQFAAKHPYDRNTLKADMDSRPSGSGACSSSSLTEEYDHARR
jgi:hypothetical protein